MPKEHSFEGLVFMLVLVFISILVLCRNKRLIFLSTFMHGNIFIDTKPLVSDIEVAGLYFIVLSQSFCFSGYGIKNIFLILMS